MISAQFNLWGEKGGWEIELNNMGNDSISHVYIIKPQ